jgi:hypothetical protein
MSKIPYIEEKVGNTIFRSKLGRLHSENDKPAMDNNEHGEQLWYRNGKLHRAADLPARVQKRWNATTKQVDSLQDWYRDGLRHREKDKPASIDSRTGRSEYVVNGKLHRDNDLPAIETQDAEQAWYQHGMLHREDDKPALINHRGRFWYQHGNAHREGDKPARILDNGQKEWWLHDKRIKVSSK